MNETDFKIESGVPVPELRVGRHCNFPFKEMKIGDSFFVSDTRDTSQVRSAASYFGIRNAGYRFTVRREGNGVRVWRVPVPA